MVTCWIALDDCIEGVGTLQFVVGSHRWPLLRDVRAVLADLRRPPHERAAEATAIQAGIQDYKVESVTGSAGLCVFHHGYVWHGSESNTSATQMRRSLAIHYLSDITRYGNGTPKFLFARYKDDTDELSSRHFPILWRAEEAKG
jgi:phytanoyl-CoA hydroxylase